MDPNLSVPPDPSFEQAIDFSQALLNEMAAERLTAAEMQSIVTKLVATENGARGLFVSYLGDRRTIFDAPTEAVVVALRTSPTIVAELLVKNLAMSSAMAITHRRNHQEERAQGSEVVRSRTQQLIAALQLPEIQERAAKLHASAANGGGDYQAFLDRWGYDAEQRQTIEKMMANVIQS